MIILLSDGPELENGPQSRLVVKEGDLISLICGYNLESNPQPQITWTKPSGKGEDLLSDNRYSRSDGPEVVSLNITSVNKHDNGTWRCTVELVSNETYMENCSPNQEIPIRRKEHIIELIVVSKLIC